MKYRWTGGGGLTTRIMAGNQTARCGEEITLTDAEYAYFTKRGFVLEPIKRGGKAPADEEVVREDVTEIVKE